jgi:exonuclease VII large subunit
MEALLRNLSPRAPLEKGYAYITDINGQVIKRSEALQTGVAQVHFYDGIREVEVKK